MDLQTLIASVSGNQKAQVLYGMEAYSVPLQLRIESRPKLVKQLINQDKVPQFHAATGELVQSIISKRVEYGIAMKNLLTYADPVKEIEKSNPATLKETRMLPKEFMVDLILVTFNDYVVITKLIPDDCFAVVIKDAVVAASFDAVFESLWGLGKDV
jgi:hypothetical protein